MSEDKKPITVDNDTELAKADLNGDGHLSREEMDITTSQIRQTMPYYVVHHA